jgi:Luciferase
VTDQLRDALLAIEGVYEHPSRYRDDLGYWVSGKEIAHFDSERALDVRLTRSVITERRNDRADPWVRLRPSSSADWITVDLTGPGASELAIDLVGHAAAAHR